MVIKAVKKANKAVLLVLLQALQDFNLAAVTRGVEPKRTME
jgi:hypothetical protein